MMKIFSKQKDRSIDDATLMKIDKAIDKICEKVCERQFCMNEEELILALATLIEARAKVD